MEITKTWKQKTKSVALATVVATTVAFAGVGGSAAPAAAQTNNRICVGAEDGGEFTHFYKRRLETSCANYFIEWGVGVRTEFESPSGSKWIAGTGTDGPPGDEWVDATRVEERPDANIWYVDTSKCENFTAYYLPDYDGRDFCFEMDGKTESSSTEYDMCSRATMECDLRYSK